MKARVLSELNDLLDREFAWRLKELTTVNSSIKSSAPLAKPMLIRCATALLYAHWEGFIKNASEAYLYFVSCRKLPCSQLNKAFVALTIRSKLVELESSTISEKHNNLVDFLLNDLNSTAHLPFRGIIKTKSNLNSTQFKNIVFTLGLDYSLYELKEHLLDAQLLAWRNNIAHGQELYPKESDFDTLFREVLQMIREFKDQIANAASLKLYCKENILIKKSASPLNVNSA